MRIMGEMRHTSVAVNHIHTFDSKPSRKKPFDENKEQPAHTVCAPDNLLCLVSSHSESKLVKFFTQDFGRNSSGCPLHQRAEAVVGKEGHQLVVAGQKSRFPTPLSTVVKL